ncbi:hypothetical protein [Paenibacillus lignilyticus]|uniref:Alpha-L-rhamnosidase six-hairpin glycosidase domain-containing protein n=1 Tax=Paenibacillus lignilyticus TaxID=1172615 RepID=A0ABS5C693_9BACL|nr:hypothetical protein [Paenibacillus lignilyticus]MBP3961517.1 hypothetical protein [Paenibacillus lignilyticus]
MKTTYSVNRGLIESEKGIPESPRWFSDSRLNFQIDENAVTQVNYHNPLAIRGCNTIFLQRLWDGFRHFVELDGVTQKLSYSNSKLWPFGVESECEVHGVKLQHRMMAVEESIVFQVTTPQELPLSFRYKMEFYKDFALIPADSQDFRFSAGGTSRVWEEWSYDEAAGLLHGSFLDIQKEREAGHPDDININNPDVSKYDREEPVPLFISIGADFPIGYSKRPLNSKYILTGGEALEPNRTYSFIISFDCDKEALLNKAYVMSAEIEEAVSKQYARYERIRERSPILNSPYEGLNDFMSLIPLYHESCKVTDVPGAIKAKNKQYWVWGWDGITSNYASLYWGDQAFIGDMLRFYEETADAEWGIAHSYRHDMSLNSVSALPAQSMYISLLQQYYATTGNKQDVLDRYDFVKRIFNLILTREVQGTGFCEGASLFPDFPAFMHETGTSDISSLNNTIFYCAARSMEYLAELVGDQETKDRAKAVFSGIEKNFLPLFYDEEKQFVVSSIDSRTLQKRNSFNANAVKWESHYLSDLMEKVNAGALEFFANHIVCKAGLREIPIWSDAFDMDANQLHCWWPVTGEYFMQLINDGNRPDLIEQWIGWVSYWTGKLTCPEGISCYIDTAEPDVDRWNTENGTWHAYSMRGWYQAAIHGVVGVSMEAGGITFHPYAGEEMTLEGLYFGEQRLDIAMIGSGPYVESIEVEGHVLEATNKLPVDAAGAGQGGASQITVRRVQANPYPFSIQKAFGIELSDYSYADGVIRAQMEGAGTSRLKLIAQREPVVTIGGKSMSVLYDAAAGKATVEVDLKAGRREELVIQ